MYKHPCVPALQLLNAHRDWADAFDLQQLGYDVSWTPVFYTDGSCAFPQLHGGVLAAYSVVFDTLPPESSQAMVASQCRHTNKIPITLRTIVVAQTPGPQTINRAEFGALLHIVRSVQSADIYTDSQWALDSFALITENPDYRDHVMRENSDLLFSLCQLARTRELTRFRLHKIRSHMTDEEVHSDKQLYHVLGNRLADFAAGKGTACGISTFNRTAHQVGNWMMNQRTLLQQVQPFVIAAFQSRLDALQSAKQPTRVHQMFDLEEALMWQPAARPLFVFEPTADKMLLGFLPGAGVFECIKRWAATLQWPLDDNTTQGISSYELLCNFVGNTHCDLPRPSNPGEQYLQYVDVTEDDMAQLLHASPWEAVRILESAFTYSRKFLGLPMIPENVQKAQKAYLSLYGYKGKVSGYSSRPILPQLVEHVHTMSELVTEKGLRYPRPFRCDAIGPRIQHHLDHLSHETRVKHLRCHYQEVRRYGELRL
eukprot:Skav229534  [mRNA]  locus=scaffold451:276587:278038:+ [translate_table: standard]